MFCKHCSYISFFWHPQQQQRKLLKLNFPNDIAFIWLLGEQRRKNDENNKKTKPIYLNRFTLLSFAIHKHNYSIYNWMQFAIHRRRRRCRQSVSQCMCVGFCFPSFFLLFFFFCCFSHHHTAGTNEAQMNREIKLKIKTDARDNGPTSERNEK